MDCRSTFEDNILIFHLKRKAGWIFPLVNSYQKKCTVGGWVHKFVFEVEKIENCNFLSYLKKKKLLIEKKNKEENEIEYNCWCNRDKIEKMTEQIFNWKVNLVFLKIIFIDFHF